MKKVVGLLLAVAFTSSAAFGGTVAFTNASSGGDGSILELLQGTSGTFDVWITESTGIESFDGADFIMATRSDLTFDGWVFSNAFLAGTTVQNSSVTDQIADATEFKVGGISFSGVMTAPILVGTLTISAAQDMALGDYELFVDFTQEEFGVSVLSLAGVLDPLSGSATISVVPEPATLALLGLGGIAVLRRRRR